MHPPAILFFFTFSLASKSHSNVSLHFFLFSFHACHNFLVAPRVCVSYTIMVSIHHDRDYY